MEKLEDRERINPSCIVIERVETEEGFLVYMMDGSELEYPWKL